MVYFARHGESEANIEKVFSNKGFKHPLTAKGINQTIELADKLKERNINKIVSSPVLRAIQTASIIANRICIKSFEVHEYLREYDVGDLEGKSDKSSWDLYFENEKYWKDINKRNACLPGGESFIEIQNRFMTFMSQIISDSDYSKKNLLIVTHGGFLKIGLPSMCINVDYDFTCNTPINNCELIVCDIIGDKIRCLNWGNTILN